METSIKNLTHKEVCELLFPCDVQTINELNEFHDHLDSIKEEDDYYDWLSCAVGDNYDFPEDWKI